ncbi:electron transport complex subunit G [Bacteroidia bacterium]|nr:electron transport complex subunit G [Bacteroidia bacterium]
MKKKPSTLVNMIVSLTLISGLAGLCLGAVYSVTKDPIDQAKLAKQAEAIKAVLPPYDSLCEPQVIAVAGGNVTLHKAYNGAEWVGTAVNTFSKQGFSGEIRLMIGVLPDGSIKDINVLEHHETPGLGDKMDIKKSNFSVQFRGKNPATFNLKVKKDGGDVDAITAATISSRAYCDALQRAVTVAQN